MNPSTNPNDFVIERNRLTRNSIKSILTKSFTHYWSITGIEKAATFKNLRKTYITKMFDLLGDSAKSIKHTADTQVIKHYLNEKEIIGKLTGVRMYQF